MIGLDEWWAGGVRLANGIFTRADGPEDAPVITWLHGFPTSSWDWAGMVERLPGVRHVTLDLLGYGASAKPLPHDYSLMEQTDLVEQVWAHHGVTTTALVCHDYSVSIGQELLARRAEARGAVMLTQLAFLNGGLFPHLHRPTPVQEQLAGPAGPELATHLNEELFGAALAAVLTTPPSAEELHGHWRALSREDGHLCMPPLLGYIAERRAQEERWVGALAADDLPKRFIWGPDDPVSGGHVVPEIQARLPTAQLHVLEGVGHYPQLEAPDRVAPLLATLV